MNKLTLNEVYGPLVFQLLRFGIVGVTAASVHFCVVVLLVQTLTMQPLVANIFGFVVSFQVSYWGHSMWTFSDSQVLHRAALPKLLLVQIISLAVNESMFYILLSFHLPYPVALLIVLSILPAVTFLSSKLWVFR